MLFSAELPWCLVFVQKSTFGKNTRKYTKNYIFPEDSRSQKERSGRPRCGPDMTQARAQAWPRLGGVWPPSMPSRFAFRIYDLRDVKSRGGFEAFPETSPLRRHHQKPYSGDQKLRSSPLPGWGNGGDHPHHHPPRLYINHP